MATWNTSYETTPPGSQAVGAGDDNIRELKGAIRERLTKEHTMDLASGLASEDGFHRPGSAIASYGTSNPSTRPNGTNFTSIDSGRLFVKSDERNIAVYDDTLTSFYTLGSPVGMIAPFPISSRTGWLSCDGSIIDKSTNVNYTELVDLLKTEANYVVSGQPNQAYLPNLQGAFIRGIDNAGTRDSAGTRASGDYKADELKKHTHTDTVDTTGAHTHTTDITHSHNLFYSFGGNLYKFWTNIGEGVWDAGKIAIDTADEDGYGLATTNSYADSPTSSSEGDHTHVVTIADAGTKAEAFPKNVALFYMIKF